MKPIHLVEVAEADHALLSQLTERLARAFGVSCHVRHERVDAAPTLDPRREQYYSTAILQLLQDFSYRGSVRVLGVTAVDLYVPVLTFVFGEAQLDGSCALVSMHRLREEFYGLPPNPELLFERLLKEAVHEIGHTFGLRHCADWRCVMASTHAVERLDVKTADFCVPCRKVVDAQPLPLPD